MSMRRNILRRTISEDLHWGDYHRQEPNSNLMLESDKDPWSSKKGGIRTKSYEPTPERKNFAEPCVSDLDDVLSAGDMVKHIHDTPIRKKNAKGGKDRRSRKERLSLTSSTPGLLKKDLTKQVLKKDDSNSSLASFGISNTKPFNNSTTALN